MGKSVIQVPMEADLVERLDYRARREAVSRAALIREACALYLRHLDADERERNYEEGYRRVPEAAPEAESLAWLAAAELPSEEWPEAAR